MKLDFEYGQGMMSADLPDNTDVFIPGETVKDPPCIEDVNAATRAALLHPIGMDQEIPLRVWIPSVPRFFDDQLWPYRRDEYRCD